MLNIFITSGLMPSSTHSCGISSENLSISVSGKISRVIVFELFSNVILRIDLNIFNDSHCFRFLISTPDNLPTFSTASLKDKFSKVINQLTRFPPTPQLKQWNIFLLGVINKEAVLSTCNGQ